MKKLLALVLIIAMSVCVFAACSKEEAVDESADVKALAEKDLASIVALDAETLVANSVVGKQAADYFPTQIQKYVSFEENFLAAIDAWEISDENKEAAKAVAAEEIAKIYESFKVSGINAVVTNDAGLVNVAANISILNTSAPEYAALYTLEESVNVKAMSAEELTALVQEIAAKAQALVVDTEVGLTYEKVDGKWLILTAGISAVEVPVAE